MDLPRPEFAGHSWIETIGTAEIDIRSAGLVPVVGPIIFSHLGIFYSLTIDSP